ncbi:hypothetical protein [Candidatus Uabimicrobium amorphum]|uniref:Uncharacterized protein n=1 Tax=Uabimicrobium amorphum TaxID=2596890 RepID=A0A5S9IKR0_UABAM|nr:hypothetical protein [Candidatus Uabimicrobium amorphum]BBM83668.1 hypothetical protein UABAM_02021 [Candidatus Uabimicrobium amorphum]
MRRPLLLLFLLCCCYGQTVLYDTLVKTKSKLKIEKLRAIGNFSSHAMEYMTVSGVFVTDASWKKKKISLRVHSTDYGQEWTISQDMELLPSSKRSFRLYGHTKRRVDEIKFSVFFDGKEVIRASFSPSQRYDTFRILYVSPKNYLDGSLLQPRIQDDLKGYRNGVEMEKIQPHDLPTHWLEYRNVDALIINSDRPFLDIKSMSDPRATALFDWLKMGGHVIVSCGSHLFLSKNTFMQNLFSVAEISTESRSSEELQKFSFGKSQYAFKHPKQSAVVDDLLWTLDYGYGKITYIGGDVKNYAQANKERGFWLNCFSPRQNAQNSTVFFKDDEGDYINRADFTKERAPILTLIITLMLIYVLVIGPFNFSFLRKRNRTIYLIFTIPAIAILFSFVVLFYGFFSKGVSNIGKKISFYYSLEDNRCYAKEYLSVSSGAKSLYDIAGSEGATVTKLFDRRDEHIQYRQDNGIFIKDYPINLWETRFFRVDSVFDHNSLTVERRKNRLSVQNNLQVKIKKAYYVEGTTRYVYTLSAEENSSFTFQAKPDYSLKRYGDSQIFWEKQGVPSHFAKVISSEIQRYISYTKRDFIMTFIDKDFTPTQTSPRVNFNENLQILITPLTREN